MPIRSLYFRPIQRLVALSIIIVFLFGQSTSVVAERSAAPHDQIEDLIESMSPAEKVGQLFLVTFNGSDTNAPAPIFELIRDHHIGGVVLRKDNGNFPDVDQTSQGCWDLVRSLQNIEHNTSNLSISDEIVDDPVYGNRSSEYVPLFIGISQEGDRSQYSELTTGLSPIPSQLALGATWDPDLAEDVGEQVGRELSSLGINMLFGPSLDVLTNPTPGQSDLGVRSFGGDPYWVGKLGQSYINGVHNGSYKNIIVVGKYFPGLGGSDRLPEEEVATVRKSLEQLEQIDLAPFFAVTGDAPTTSHAVDALLNSHIRYQGLQGNIRSTTRPISLDPQAFDLLMNLEPLSSWRDSGGLIISDNLGSQAIQQLYDPTGTSFSLSRVALDAFIAGNDILLLGNSGVENKPISNFEIISTLEFFSQKYVEDTDFAEKVDSAVARILESKKSVYPIFNIATVLTSEQYLSDIGSSNVSEIVSRRSATIINPGIADLDNVIQNPPDLPDRIVILSDVESYKLCDECAEEQSFSASALEDAIIKLYGPLSGRQLGRANINSYSFKDLTTLLDFPSEAEDMTSELDNANWILIATLGENPERPYSSAFLRLLSERQDLLRGKTIIVFAFGAPYYLDATNISKVSAYFGLYTKIPSSLDVAARILFKEFTSFPGDLPVSVPGINYDLISATSPDPDQLFPIYIGEKPLTDNPGDLSPSTPVPSVYRVEDIIDIHTGTIIDHNGNPVPDGTPVTFFITSQGESISLPQVTTIDGSAFTNYLIQETNNISIHAESSLARSPVLELNILGDNEDLSSEISPTNTIQITESPSPPPSDNNTSNDDASSQDTEETQNYWRTWFYTILCISAIMFAAYRLGATSGRVRQGILWAFSAAIGGLITYNYALLGFPWTSLSLPHNSSQIFIIFLTIAGSVLGWLIAYLSRLVKR